MNFPTSTERLKELMAKFEAATTDGEITLTGDDIGDVYQWMLWVADSFESPIPSTERQFADVGRTYMSGVHSVPEAKMEAVLPISELLRKYGNHQDGCLARPDCSCGWDRIAEQLQVKLA